MSLTYILLYSAQTTFCEGVKLEMILVPAGKFKMGHTKKELEELNEELMEVFPKRIQDLIEELISSQKEQHEVTLTKPF